MKKYILKRVILSLLVILGVITTTFFITRVIPSNPAAKWVGPRATPEQVEQAKEELGLNDPLSVQYGNYLKDLSQGDLGRSLRTHQPVAEDLKSFVPPTLELVVLAFIFAIILGIPLGIYSAKKKDRMFDHGSRMFSIGAVSLPTFWVAMVLQIIFYKNLGLFPIGGRVSLQTSMFYDLPDITGLLILDCILTGEWYILKDALWHIALPCITISLYPIGLVARTTRSALLEILNEDYITAARSYGLRDRLVLWKYALKNTLGTTATVVALSLGYTLTNTFLVETIFSWPGLGNYISTSVVTLDYPAIIGVTIFASISYILFNLIADIIIAMDPRIRL